MTPPRTDCRHEWRAKASTGDMESPRVFFRCRLCDAEAPGTRKASPALAAAIQAEFVESAEGIHAVLFDLWDRFTDPTTGEFRLHGWPLMQELELWARRWPGDARIVPCDDECHMGSWLVLIEHRTTHSYMGTSVMYVPQHHGPPVRFFLYPCDRGALAAALKSIARAARPVKRREAAQARRIAALWEREEWTDRDPDDPTEGHDDDPTGEHDA